MPLYITHERITELPVEAIVTFGSRDGSGLELIPCENRVFRYVLRVDLPRHGSLADNWRSRMRAAYEAALDYAGRRGLESIALPLGVGQEDATQGLGLAREIIGAFLAEHDLTVLLTTQMQRVSLPEDELFRGVAQRVADISCAPDDDVGLMDFGILRDAYEDFYQRVERDRLPQRQGPLPDAAPAPKRPGDALRRRPKGAPHACPPSAPSAAPRPWMDDDGICCASAASLSAPPMAHQPDGDVPADLIQQLHNLDAGFSATLLRLIDERGMTDPECYRRANVDRKLFSKIRSNPDYAPKKTTAVALCVALRLDMGQTRELLARAGYGMSSANRFDVIVGYFITRGVFDVHVINQALWSYDQPLLGSTWREA